MNINTKEQLHSMYYNKKMTLCEIGKICGISHTAIAKRMEKYGLKRRNRSDTTYTYYNKTECFHVDGNEKRLLKNIGLMLYWCEGVNDVRYRDTVAFTNTSVDMLKIWIKFLRKICNLKANKIKARIYVHKNQDGEALKKYWSKKLGISLDNFENVSYTNKNSTRANYKGTVKIKVHNVKLFDTIQAMILELTSGLLE